MSIEAMIWARRLKLPPRDKFVLVALADYANDDGRAWPKQETLAEWTCYGRDTISHAIQALEHEHKVITTEERRYPDGRRASKIYQLHLGAIPHVGDAHTVPPPNVGAAHTVHVGETHTVHVGETHTVHVGEAHNRNPQHRTPNIEPPSTPPTPQPAATPPTEQPAEEGEDREVRYRPPPRNGDRIQALMKRHPTTWTALCRTKNDRAWKPAQFQAIAGKIYELAERHGERPVTAALEDLLLAGDSIKHPIRWLEKVFTDEQHPPDAAKAKREPESSLLEELRRAREAT